MKIEIAKKTTQVEVIEVELPYYYRHDLVSDYSTSVIYGKIEEKISTSIQETKSFTGTQKYEIEKEEHSSIKDSGLGSYFEESHKSTQKEFEEVRQRCQSFIDSL